MMSKLQDQLMLLCRFMDEQEVGRDRSASPNYHSLIYGDTKKKTDSRAESLSNGSNERSESGSEPGVAGVQVLEGTDCGFRVAGGEPSLV